MRLRNGVSPGRIDAKCAFGVQFKPINALQEQHEPSLHPALRRRRFLPQQTGYCPVLLGLKPQRSQDMLFLSYPRRIAPVALSLKAELEKRGYTVFLDLTELDGGLWSDQLKVAIERSTDFLIIVSEDTATSEAMRKEAQMALASELSIVPLFVLSYEPVASAPTWMAEILRYQAARLDPLDPSVTVDRAVRLFKGHPHILLRLNKQFLVSLVLVLSVAFVASIFLAPTPQRPLKPNTSSSKAPSDGPDVSESAVARSTTAAERPVLAPSPTATQSLRRPQTSPPSLPHATQRSVALPSNAPIGAGPPLAPPATDVRSAPTKFEFHDGYFEWQQAGSWAEFHIRNGAPQRFTSYKEFSRDERYIYLEDAIRSRPDSQSMDPMLVRLPILGGRFEWTWRSEREGWRALHSVRPIGR